MECNFYDDIKIDFLSEKDIKNIVFSVLEEVDQKGMVSIHIVGDEKIRDLNERYRDKDETTDVLSFSALEGQQFQEETVDLGDIFISLPQIKKQAKEYEVSNTEEFVRMLVHGILHLLGYDHQEQEESKKMFSLQKKIIKEVLDEY
jgi:probable rRNA maturation factor